MKDKVEIWITVNCRKVIKDALVNRGIAMGNEYRFDDAGWKIIVTRTADLFLEVLRRAAEHRITSEYGDLGPIWRMAVGDDELMLVPHGEDRAKELTRIREIVGFVRDLLYETKFVAIVLRAVLTEAFRARWEEPLLAGGLDREAAIEKLVGELNSLDLAKAAAALRLADAPQADQPAPAAEIKPAEVTIPTDTADDDAPEGSSDDDSGSDDDGSDDPSDESPDDAEEPPAKSEKKSRKRRKKKGS